MPKKALITGITGQDGSYLAELLLHKSYEVHGIIRRASTFNTKRIDHLYKDPHNKNIKMFLHYGDMTDSSNLNRILEKVQPDEIYNLAAQNIGDYSKAKRELGWQPKVKFEELVKIMVKADWGKVKVKAKNLFSEDPEYS